MSRKASNHSVNIIQIAKEADTSIATVSRVLNNSEKVKPDTRQKILSIIQKHGYKPKIKKNKITNVCVIVNDKQPTFSPYLAELLEGISDTVTEMNLEETIIFINETEHPEIILETLRERKVDAGIIILSSPKTPYLSRLKKNNFPFILLNNSAKQEFSFIDTDHEQGIEQAAEYLYQMGHRKFILLLDDIKFHNFAQRKKAFDIFLASKKLPEQRIFQLKDLPNYPFLTPMEQGKIFMERFISEPFEETAILAANDDAALGILNVCFANKIAVPEKLSVIGFDNYKISQFINPPLTTINQNLHTLGREAVYGVISLLNSDNVNMIQKKLSCELVIRRTTGPAPA